MSHRSVPILSTSHLLSFENIRARITGLLLAILPLTNALTLSLPPTIVLGAPVNISYEWLETDPNSFAFFLRNVETNTAFFMNWTVTFDVFHSINGTLESDGFGFSELG